MSYAQSLKEKLEERLVILSPTGYPALNSFGYPTRHFWRLDWDDRLHEKVIMYCMNILGDLGDTIKDKSKKLINFYQGFIQRKQEHGFTKTISISYREFRKNQKAFYKRCLRAQRFLEEASIAAIKADRMYRALRF